jgi:hypothetical protein
MSTHQSTLGNIAVGKGHGVGLKQGLGLAGKFTIAFVVMLVSIVVSAALIDTGVRLPTEEASQSGPALLIVSLIDSLVLGYIILRSRWYGVKLIAAVAVVHFGVQTFMSQIETLYFIGALKMPLDMVLRIIAMGLLRAVIFAPIAVILLGKFHGTASAENRPRLAFPLPEWLKRFAILAIVYVIVYFAFGYFVAFQWAEARDYYAGTFSNDISLPLFQILRGAMWAALALPIVKMMKGQVWETCLAVGLVFAVLLASGVIFPNPFMPPMVRQAHFFELSSSMLAYGAIAGWVWARKVGSEASKG